MHKYSIDIMRKTLIQSVAILSYALASSGSLLLGAPSGLSPGRMLAGARVSLAQTKLCPGLPVCNTIRYFTLLQSTSTLGST